MARILIADDEDILRKGVDRFLSGQGYEVFAAPDGSAAFKIAEKEQIDVAIIDLVMPKMDGMELIKKLHQKDPAIAIIVVTGYGTISSAVEAIKAGAYHYLTKPFDLNDLSAIVERALEHHDLKAENTLLKDQLRDKYQFENMIGRSEAMLSVFSLVKKIAPTDSTILILGESGTGKELIANALHFNSRRKDKPFVIVNCAAIPEQLLETELFGHVKGAFTGAIATRPGRFDSANGGTIFLDEIGDMSPKLQVKLLRVLQEQAFEPVGSNVTHEVDVRVVAATNTDLMQAVRERKFREDLYYRLNVIPVCVPPLRERKSDIKLLLQHFITKCNQKDEHAVEGFDDESLKMLMSYDWPGNIRELENAVERAVVLRPRGLISASELPQNILNSISPISEVTLDAEDISAIQEIGQQISFRDAVKRYEKKIIDHALETSGGNRNKAARMLGINRTTLVEKMKKFKPKES